jgi:RNA polymerase sigma-70 factor (ECF subfamily)
MTTPLRKVAGLPGNQGEEDFGAEAVRYADAVFNVVVRMIGDTPEARALLHRIVSAVSETADLSESRMVNLYRTAIHVCRDWLKHHSRDGEDRSDRQSKQIHVLNGLPRSGDEIIVHLDRAMRRLPLRYREAFVLRHLEGLGYEDMASILDLHQEAVRMLVYKARMQLAHEWVRFLE